MSKKYPLTRRQFILNSALLAAGAGMMTLPNCSNVSVKDKDYPINRFGLSADVAHILRDQHNAPSTALKYCDVVIVGSGISALSAARELYLNGQTNFKILELESFYGGNAASSNIQGMGCSWGSHYLPILSETGVFLQNFLETESVITDYDTHGNPVYNDLYLCHDLKERLYINGAMQSGLIPRYGVPQSELDEIDRFHDMMDDFKNQKGQDGLFAFSIPVAMSSSDPKFRALENISMQQFLIEHDFQSKYLNWYINYYCRDDYGANIEQVSAWAGIHYHASRRSTAANAEEDSILTWPEGNGFLANKLAAPFLANIMPQSLAYEVTEIEKGVRVDFIHTQSRDKFSISCDNIILAVPEFVAYHLLKNSGVGTFSKKPPTNYAPWLVANITVDTPILQNKGEVAWDNISLYSQSLGYVNTKHQLLDTNYHTTIITFYMPLDSLSPSEARQLYINKPLSYWQDLIVKDLQKIHPNIQNHIHRMDIRLYGHGMCIPKPGFIWGHAQKRERQLSERIYIAHSDMSGISLFEEAFWQGLKTAEMLI